jgi:hypothetical protein
MSQRRVGLSMTRKFMLIALVVSSSASLTACKQSPSQIDLQTPTAAVKQLNAAEQLARLEGTHGGNRTPLELSGDVLKGMGSRKTFIDDVSAMAKPEELVEVNGSSGSTHPIALLMTYSPSRQTATGEEAQSASCSVLIVEDVVGVPKVVERNDRMLNCSMLPSAEAARAAISSNVSDREISIADRAARGGDKFDFEKGAGGAWLVKNVQFVHTENNTDTGFVDVVTEEARYVGKNQRLRVSDYNYDAIKPNLIRKIAK